MEINDNPRVRVSRDPMSTRPDRVENAYQLEFLMTEGWTFSHSGGLFRAVFVDGNDTTFMNADNLPRLVHDVSTARVERRLFRRR